MAFRPPPPQYYLPPQDRTIPRIIMVITIIAIIIIVIVFYISLRRLTLTKCRNDLDCPNTKGKCDRELGICQECLQSSDCPTGLYCSTAYSCV